MTDRLAPGVGEVFGEYIIESLLGRGGMGAVYLATHERLTRKVALKVITPERALDDEFRERFLRESRLAASLDHVAHEPVRLRADRNLMPLVSADEDETSLVRVIAEAITCLLVRSGRSDYSPGGL